MLRLILPIAFVEYIFQHDLVVTGVGQLRVLRIPYLFILGSSTFNIWVRELLADVDGPADPTVGA